MLKQLTDEFYRLSTEAEALLQGAIAELQEERVPSAEDTLRITAALTEVQTAYGRVRAYTAQSIAAEDMPGEQAPVSAYTAIICSKRMITEGILREFLLVYTGNGRYEDALKDAQEKARQLLRAFQEEPSDEPDVAPYKAFVDGIRMGENIDSDAGDRILDLVETLDKKLARGLQGGHFALREAADYAEADGKPKEPAETCAEQTVGETQAEAEASATSDDADKPVLEEREGEYVCARSYREYTSLPSEKKLYEAFIGQSGAVVLDSIGVCSVISCEFLDVCTNSSLDRQEWEFRLSSLEKKGYLAAYEVEGEVYYCPTPMLSGCIGKPDRAKVLQNVRSNFLPPKADRRRKRILAPLLVGEEKLLRSTLVECIAWLKVCIAFLKIDMSVYFEWDQGAEAYRVTGVGDAKGSAFTDVMFVTPDRYIGCIGRETGAVGSYGDTLPDADAMHGAAAKDCFFLCGGVPYRWEEREWKAFDWREPVQEEPEAETDQEPVQERNIPEEPVQDRSVPEVPADKESGESVKNEDTAAQGTEHTGQRERYLALAHEAYAAGRRGIGSAMLRALAQTHHEVEAEWRRWACASEDPAYTEGRNATRLQEIYHNEDSAGLADLALAASAYIRMYFSNDAASEYWVKSTAEMESAEALQSMKSLRELMRSLQDYVDKNKCGINQATLTDLRQETSIEDQFVQLREKARGYVEGKSLADTNVSNPRIKDLFEQLFGKNSLLIEALECVCDDRRGEAGVICSRLEQIDPGLTKNSPQAIINWIEQLWNGSTKKMKGKNPNDNLKGPGRNNAVNRTKTTLSVINQWIGLCIHNDGLPEKTIMAAAAEVQRLAQTMPAAIEEVRECRRSLEDAAEIGALRVLEDTLAHYLGLMNGTAGVEPAAVFNEEIAACSAMAVEEDGTVYIVPAENMAVPYEQCEILAGILEQPPVAVEAAVQRFVDSSMTEDSFEGGNFSNGRYLLRCAARRQQTFDADYGDSDYTSKVKGAAAIAAIEERKFHAHMEMAWSYGWFNSASERERIEHAVAEQCGMYRVIDDYSACAACMKRTFRWCRQTARDAKHDQSMADLNGIVARFGVDRNNAAIVRIGKLIDQDCYTAAEAEIRKIQSDGWVEEQYAAVKESRFEFFVQNFQSYYQAVGDVNEGLEAIFNRRNGRVHRGYVNSGKEMLRSWPYSSGALQDGKLTSMLTSMNLEVDGVRIVRTNADPYASVRFKPKRSMKFVHPIADFGTNMLKGGLDVYYIGGKKNAEQYFEMIRSQIGYGQGHAALFLANSAMSLSVRRQLTSKIWHELGSAKPLIVLDRVLALYVAESDKVDRWNVLLQCALPFTMVKPYTEKSNAEQPPEMFVGRVTELSQLMSFKQDSANLVYGGRQLGKSAILYRVEQEKHNEAEAEYAVFCSIKDKDAAGAVPEIVLAMRRKRVPDAEKIGLDASWAKMCLAINAILTEHPDMKLMLLIDEADVLLGRDRETSYSALSEIKRVQDAFGGRFKFVLAGLHNVMRLHHIDAVANNSDLPKMGSINIKPLDYADAEMLLKKPLSYMGFLFDESEEEQALISMILSTTNYYPGLIHYYCASLLNTLGDGHTDPAPSKPPYELDNKRILNLLQKEAFMEQTRQKFMMTLGIDKGEHQYYSILAYLMAYCYDENESQVDGVSVEEICAAAEGLDIAVINRLEYVQVETLLDELCELNILYSALGLQPKRYVFSRPAFKDMLGSRSDVEAALLNYMGIEEVSQ